MSVTSRALRATLVDALHDVDAAKDVPPARMAAFEAGQGDIEFRDLLLGSLARMELLVALEMEHGVIIAPREFARFKGMNDLVEWASHAEAEPLLESNALPAESEDPGVEPVVRLFRRMLRRCRAVAQVNKNLKLLEQRLTPERYRSLREAQRAGSLLPGQESGPQQVALAEWFEELDRLMESAGKPSPEPYEMRRVAPTVVHFRGPGERSSKTLLVCFATIGGRQLWIPNCVLLQYADAERYDVLMLSDPLRTGFRGGVPQMGSSVDDVVDWLGTCEAIRGYGAVRTLGCSAGAYPALLSACRLDAELGISMSGRFPRKKLRNLREIFEICGKSRRAARGAKRSKLLLVHGTRRRDRFYARHIAWLTGGTRVRVRVPGQEVRHNLMHSVLRQRELDTFFASTVFASLEADLLSGQKRSAELSFSR